MFHNSKFILHSFNFHSVHDTYCYFFHFQICKLESEKSKLLTVVEEHKILLVEFQSQAAMYVLTKHTVCSPSQVLCVLLRLDSMQQTLFGLEKESDELRKRESVLLQEKHLLQGQLTRYNECLLCVIAYIHRSLYL